MGSPLTLWKRIDGVYATKGSHLKHGRVVCQASMHIRGAEFVSEDSALRDLKARVSDMGANAALELSKTRFFTGPGNRRHECFYFSARPALVYSELKTSDYRESLMSKELMESDMAHAKQGFEAVNREMSRKEAIKKGVRLAVAGGVFLFFFLPIYYG